MICEKCKECKHELEICEECGEVVCKKCGERWYKISNTFYWDTNRYNCPQRDDNATGNPYGTTYC